MAVLHFFPVNSSLYILFSMYSYQHFIDIYADQGPIYLVTNLFSIPEYIFSFSFFRVCRTPYKYFFFMIVYELLIRSCMKYQAKLSFFRYTLDNGQYSMFHISE